MGECSIESSALSIAAVEVGNTRLIYHMSDVVPHADAISHISHTPNWEILPLGGKIPLWDTVGGDVGNPTFFPTFSHYSPRVHFTPINVLRDP